MQGRVCSEEGYLVITFAYRAASQPQLDPAVSDMCLHEGGHVWQGRPAGSSQCNALTIHVVSDVVSGFCEVLCEPLNAGLGCRWRAPSCRAWASRRWGRSSLMMPTGGEKHHVVPSRPHCCQCLKI